MLRKLFFLLAAQRGSSIKSSVPNIPQRPIGKGRDACRRKGRHARRMRSLHNRRKKH